jgi:glycerol-3-phosphate dehydrogenase
MHRDAQMRTLADRQTPWDMLIIGGGATGVGIAVDAASRGYDVLLLERSDFGKGTSSRSTKLVHGGVRYLEQGNIPLVMEALKERGILRENAPHLGYRPRVRRAHVRLVGSAVLWRRLEALQPTRPASMGSVRRRF